jgi:parallel beta-helix repeat protein
MKIGIFSSEQTNNLMKKKLFTLVVFPILVIYSSSIVVSSHQEESINLDASSPMPSVSHSPISINGNTEFDAFFEGKGTDGLTWATAHIIEGYNIIAVNPPSPAGEGSGIQIINTDRYLIIKDCFIQNSLGSTSSGGIFLQNCQNINITGCEIFDNEGGIVTWNTNHISISDNNILDGGMGIRFQYSNNCIVSDNFISSGTMSGIHLRRSHHNTISGNEASHNRLYGIKLEESTNNIISGNNASYNGYSGISLETDTENNQVYQNIVCNNERGNVDDLGSNNDVHDNEECTVLIPSYSLLWMLGFVSLGCVIKLYKMLNGSKRKR